MCLRSGRSLEQACLMIRWRADNALPGTMDWKMSLYGLVPPEPRCMVDVCEGACQIHSMHAKGVSDVGDYPTVVSYGH